jgi:DNA modification methylase
MSAVPEPRRKPTSTSEFGVGRREGHDASAFYDRFSPPLISDDATVNPYGVRDEIWSLDSRSMDEGKERIKPNSVALVVTSPPYFAGKAYETELSRDEIPSSYLEYLEMLRQVFTVCVDKLEPGGRIAVNVANLGRKPYRSLAADVIAILQDDLGLLLRGEIIWRKAGGSSGSCAWGSYQSASNPVLRDLTERVVVASKGRFDRAGTRRQRADAGLPSADTIYRDDFMDWTTDVWDIATESATRVGHPAPFPVELPQRLIELYTYRDDLVLDPFMGSGSTAVAAVRTHRHYVGFDLDPAYVKAARARAAAAVDERDRESDHRDGRPWRVVGPTVPAPAGVDPAADPADPEAALTDPEAALTDGPMAKDLAEAILTRAGFTVTAPTRRSAGIKAGPGVEVAFVVHDRTGVAWWVDLCGALTKGGDRVGLRRAETLWKTLGRAAVLHEPADSGLRRPYLVLTTDLPKRGSAGAAALAAVRGRDRPVFDAVELLTADGRARLQHYGEHGPDGGPVGELLPRPTR